MGKDLLEGFYFQFYIPENWIMMHIHIYTYIYSYGVNYVG